MIQISPGRCSSAVRRGEGGHVVHQAGYRVKNDLHRRWVILQHHQRSTDRLPYLKGAGYQSLYDHQALPVSGVCENCSVDVGKRSPDICC